MDIFELLPEEICDEIFSHFNVRDIKDASLVSKRWYHTIGQSKVCMGKLSIKRVYCLDDFDSILESKRQYQSLTINNDPSKMKQNTKFLRITREIVEKFSQSLVSIRISHDLKLKVDLPKLKMLEFLNAYYKILIVSNGLIAKAKNLKKLKINCYVMDKKSLLYIKDALLEKESLKILDVGNSSIIQGLSHANLKLQLEEFYFKPYVNPDPSIIKEFLSTQTSSLQIIACQFIKDNIDYCMSNMPKLHTLILSGTTYHQNIDNKEPEYPTNRTITKIEFQMDFYRVDRIFLHAITIMANTLNLREIQCRYLIPEMLQYLYNCPSLEVVKYKHLCYAFSQIQKNEIAQHERIKFIQVPYNPM